jgi:hypothetical protein
MWLERSTMRLVDGTLRDEISERALCWCCGGERDADQLLDLGEHPETTVCLDCATFLHRRAQRVRDEHSAGVGVVVRRASSGIRDAVISRGIHNWPVLGGLLRRIDRRLP